ncbi:MAG: SDR family oxidoreductase [Chitinophagaceae bacterium]|nr:MAG: SDR family oxidoreductase [Chitinophagaceae bacterium]
MADKIKNVLVTGADGGLGIPVVSQLLRDGWHVFAFLHNDKKVDAMRKEFPRQSEDQLSFLTGDITDMQDIENAVRETGSTDALVHLAGGFKGAATFSDHDPNVFDQMFDLNVRSAFLLIRTVLPMMKEKQTGAIVTIGARPALHVIAENAVYAASKAALIHLTLAAAEEGRSCHVRANVIAPAVIRTEANAKWAASTKELEKWTSPEDIAQTISWLISDAGSAVTGTVIPMYHLIKT